MECADVREAVRLGDESQEVLEHLAHCEPCRRAAESTLFVNGVVTEKRRPAARARGERLPWLLAAALLPIVLVLALVAARRARGPEPTAIAAGPTRLAAPAVAAPPADEIAPPRAEVERAPPFRPSDPRRPRPAASANPAPERGAVDPAVAAAPRSDAATPLRPGGEMAKAAAAPTPPPANQPPPPGERAAAPAEPEMAPLPDPPPRRRLADESPAEPEPGIDRPAPAKPGFGYLTITSDPWAKVILDGKDTGRTTPVTRLTTPVGHHTVELRARSGATVTIEVDIAARAEVAIDKTLY